MIKYKISCPFLFIILVHQLSHSVGMQGPEIDDVTTKVVENPASQTKCHIRPDITKSILVKQSHAADRNWFCIINNRTRFVTCTKRKFMKRRLHFYANCQTTFNPKALSVYLLMCGGIHPNPGPTTSDVNPTYSKDRNARGRRPENRSSNLLCMHVNARS
jgi:hypothetical protein